MKNSTGRKLHSLSETYDLLYQGMRTVKYLSKAKKNKELSSEFIERMMLAVTEVNDCAVCSYAHAKMALEAGMSQEEIQNMLAGIHDNVPAEELPAVMFSQHYAESRGNPSKESWHRITEVYGSPKARAILGAVRMIMIGNAYGVPWSSFLNRLRGKEADKRSNLPYEISMVTIGSVFIPVAIVHSLISNLLRMPIEKFPDVK